MKKFFVLSAGVAVFGLSAVVGGVTLSSGQVNIPAVGSSLQAKNLMQVEVLRTGATAETVIAALAREQIPVVLALELTQQTPSDGQPIELAAAGNFDAQQILADVRQVLLAQAGGVQRTAPLRSAPLVQTIAGLSYNNLLPEDNYPRLGAGTARGDGLYSMVSTPAYSGGRVVTPN
jgi:hypothetical protein